MIDTGEYQFLTWIPIDYNKIDEDFRKNQLKKLHECNILAVENAVIQTLIDNIKVDNLNRVKTGLLKTYLKRSAKDMMKERSSKAQKESDSDIFYGMGEPTKETCFGFKFEGDSLTASLTQQK